MREIKFKVWRKGEKVMLPKNLYNYAFTLKEFAIWFSALANTLTTEDIDKDMVFLQFTGLKDKNGKDKEVYEGDLIRACPNGYEPREIYEVVWDEERLEWGVKSKIGMITSLWTFDKDFEVIGNIYENPSLLAGETKN